MKCVFTWREQVKESYREQSMVETLLQDIRYAVRALGRSPGFTITSVATLALAIGANTVMFSVLNAALFRPLPYRSPEQLAMLWSERPNQNLREGRSAYWNVEQWRRQSRSFADMAAFDPASAMLTSADKMERISVARISSNFFSLLGGVQPVQGRVFSAEEAEQRQRLALISFEFWQTRFGGSPSALGARIELDGLSSQIIGILPAGFAFAPLHADVWEAHTLSRDWEAVRGARGAGSWFVVGRLARGVSFEQAQAEMNTIAYRLDEQSPMSAANLGVSVVPLSLQLTGPRARLALWMLTCAVFCVLLISATNAASLSLARSAGREREFAVRAALGASRTRIIRQLLAESLTLAVLSGLAGLFVTVGGIRLVLAFQPGNLVRLQELRLDPQVLGCCMGLCLFTGILVGLAPALSVAGRMARSSGRSISNGIATRKIRRALVTTEFALAIMLLAGAGLLIRSLWSVERVDPGFRTERVLSVQLAVPAFLAIGQRSDFYNRVLAQAEAIPGVKNAGMIENFFIGGSAEQALSTEGDAGPVSEHLRFRNDEVSSGFFQTLGTPLLRGRFFTAADGPDSPRVAILNEAMARRLWPGRDPVGRRFKLGRGDSSGPLLTVTGVVGNMRRLGLEKDAIPQMFTPLAQDPPRLATLLIKTATDEPLRMAGTVQAAVRRVDKFATVYGVMALEHQLDAFLTQRRFEAWLLIGFSSIAVLMAAIGIYGLIQYSVTARTKEIGIRMAVGAQASEIFRMMISEGLGLSLTGLVVGLAAALCLCRAASSLLFGVSATDPLTFLAVSLLLIAVAVAACYFPARRAMKVEPLAALREE